MIFENPFAEEIIVQFFEKLKNNGGNSLKTFRQIVETNLTAIDIEKFSTPNFMRILHFVSGQDLLLSEVVARKIRAGLNKK